MKLKDLEQQAVALPEHERVNLVCKLLGTLPASGADVSDEAVAERERELESGAVEPLSHVELVRRVQRERQG